MRILFLLLLCSKYINSSISVSVMEINGTANEMKTDQMLEQERYTSENGENNGSEMIVKESDIKCECNLTERLRKANDTLKEDIKITQIRLVEPFRNAIAYSISEKEHLVNTVKHSVIQTMFRYYSNVVLFTDFMEIFEQYMSTILHLLQMENNIPLSGIRYEVNAATDKLMIQLLPRFFLCLSLGKCRAVPLDYQNCMQENSKEWSHYLGEGPNKMAMAIADAIYRYRKVEFILIDMHLQLMNATNLTITEECVEQYAKTMPCNCSVPGIKFCNSTCSEAAETCLGRFRRDWDGKLFFIQNMTGKISNKGFLPNLLKIRKGLMDALRHLTERKSPAFATRIANNCGILGEMWIHPKRVDYSPKTLEPYTSRTSIAVKELQQSSKPWEKLSQKICDLRIATNDDQQSELCWNGTIVVSLGGYDLPPITKDVRPRPMLDWLEKKRKVVPEGSGSPLYDDEDMMNGDEGSGSGMPPIIDRSPPKHIIQIGRDHPKYIDSGPSVVINEIATPHPDASSVNGILISLLLPVIIRLILT